MWSTGQMIQTAFPTTRSIGTNPSPNRESSEFDLLSPITNSLPFGTFVFDRTLRREQAEKPAG